MKTPAVIHPSRHVFKLTAISALMLTIGQFSAQAS